MAIPSPSAQPSSVLPTAVQNLLSPSCLNSSPTVAVIAGILVSEISPARTTSSHKPSTTSTAASGATRFEPSLTRRCQPSVRRPAETSAPRSEEHTSELQSRQYLVCRLLLEKKNS